MFSKSEVDAFVMKASSLKGQLIELAETLDEHQGHYTRSSLAGSVLAGAGGVISIVGGALAIATFGASVVLLPLGAALGLAGGTIGGSALIADHFVSKKKLEVAQTSWKDFLRDPVVEKFVQFTAIPEEFQNGKTLSIWQKVKRFFRQNKAETAEGAVKATGSTGKSILKIVDLADEPVMAAASTGAAAATAGRTAFRSLSVASKALLVGGLVVDGILLPVTIYDIVQTSIEIHRGTKSPAGDTLRSLVTAIEEIEKEVKVSCESS